MKIEASLFWAALPGAQTLTGFRPQTKRNITHGLYRRTSNTLLDKRQGKLNAKWLVETEISILVEQYFIAAEAKRETDWPKQIYSKILENRS